MSRKIFDAGEVALVLLGEIPAIGYRFRSRERAVRAAQGLLRAVDYLINSSCFSFYQIIFKHQGKGHYALVVKNNTLSLEVLHNLDELLLKRFQKVFRGLFILSCFYETGDRLECLAVTDGLGAVLYSFEGYRFFQTR